MIERWQRELTRLRTIHPSTDLLERAREGPSRPIQSERWKRLGVAAIALAVAGAGVSLGAWAALTAGAPRPDGRGQPGRPGGSPANGAIAFTVHRFDVQEREDGAFVVTELDADVYVMDADGTNVRPLLATPEEEGTPAWSPDGSRIAFSTTDAIYVAHADVTGRQRLTEGRQPAWSPDGTRIAFVRPKDLPEGRYESPIHVIEADGTAATMLFDEGDVSTVTWSPDGTRIAFDMVTNDPNAVDQSPKIHVMNADGSGLTLLTEGVSPAWSPDGTRIAFVTSVGKADTEIHLMNADGTGVTQLTSLGDAGAPTWSPDGTKILFTIGHFSVEEGNRTNLYVMNPDGSGVTPLTHTADDPDLFGPNSVLGATSWQTVPPEAGG